MTSPSMHSATSEQVIGQLQTSVALPMELLEIFSQEAEDHLRMIDDGLNQLKCDPRDDHVLAVVRRAAHTLKGAAGAVGMSAVTNLAHRMEDLLDHLAESNLGVSAPQLTLLLSTADELQCLTTGDNDVSAAAARISNLYHLYDQELGSPLSFQPGHDPGAPPVTGERSETPRRWVDRSSEAKVGKSGTECIRVPIQRLDELAVLVGDLLVNRSGFQHQLHDFELRIDDLSNALNRLREFGRAPESVGTLENANEDFDSLEFERFAEFSHSEQSLLEADKDAEIMSREFRALRTAFQSSLRRQQVLLRDLQKGLLRVRLVPLGSIQSRIERTVRTVAAKLEREVHFEMIGESIALDKTVLDEITEPILHLIRNAIDHGAEPTVDRIAAGKPEFATIRLEAWNEGTRVRLRLSDDGGGIDSNKVRQKAVALGLIDANRELIPAELFSLIFQPGFSTADRLTEVSGRGVGMDVVADAISRLNGTIRVDSQTGLGTTFTIELPTSLGVTRAVLVETEGKKFAIPMSAVQEFRQLSPGSVVRLDNRAVIRHGDRDIRLIELGCCLRKAESPSRTPDQAVPILILGQGFSEMALAVDAISGCREIVVKSLGNHLKNLPGFVGATIGVDGQVVPIVDVASLIQTVVSGLPPAVAVGLRASTTSRSKLAMIVDDSISIRRVTENVLQSYGWDTVSAKDGVEALEKLDALESPPDVFLTDMEMPRMDGLELIRQIRDQSEFGSTPIVMITSRASEKHRHKAFQAGASEYIVKPFNEEQLLERIDQLVFDAQESALL